MAAAIVAIAACEFEQVSKIDIDPFTIPQGTDYAEQTVEVPDEARDQAVTFDSAQVDYRIESSSDFSFESGMTEISFYVSGREAANEDNGGPESEDERVFTVVLENDDDLGSGSANSAKLVDILNSGQETFVVALDVDTSGITFTGELTLELTFTVEYSVSVP